MNPYEICVANRTINGHQQTVTWHVVDVKASHTSSEVNKEFLNWCEEKYGSELNRHVKIVNGKIREYLAMKLDYSIPEKLRVDMREEIKELLITFPKNFQKI